MKPRKSATKRHKTHKIIFCVFCAASWLIPPSQAQPDGYTLHQVFAKMDEVQKRFRSAAADIERTHVTVLVNDKDVSSGMFYYARRGKQPRVKLELSKLAPQYLLIDKGNQQSYIHNLKQVQQTYISGHQVVEDMFMAVGFVQSIQDLIVN